MKNFLKSLTENIIMTIIISVFTIGYGYFMLKFDLYSSFFPSGIPDKDSIVLLAWIAVVFSFLLLISAIFLMSIWIKSKKKLKYEFGVLWDKDFNSYCPVCKDIRLVIENALDLQAFYRCKKCNQPFDLQLDNGVRVDIKRTIEYLKSKKN